MAIDYEKLPKLSKDFLNEVYFRTESTQRCLDIFKSYKRKKAKNEQEYIEFQSIKYVIARFSVLELTTLFDGRGELSLKLHKKNLHYIVQPQSLKKFLPTHSKIYLNTIELRLNQILKKNSSLLMRMVATRREKIAHASVSRYKQQKIYLTSFKFPFSSLYYFASDIQRLFGLVLFNLPPDYDFDKNSEMYGHIGLSYGIRSKI